MKLIDAINKKGRPFEIPDCSRYDLPEFFKELGFTRGAEIGVMTGEFSEHFAKAGLEHYAIDPWRFYGDYQAQGGQRRIDKYHAAAVSRLAPYPNCHIIRKTSMEALEDIPNDSLDYIYIDGNHHLMYVIQDLCEWSKKVRTGGIIAGHDFFYTAATNCLSVCHVAQAVKAYVHSYGVENWWILGSKVPNSPDEERDRWRSWMWFNQRVKYE